MKKLDEFKEGKISRDEYLDFLKLKTIELIVNCEKDDVIGKLDDARNLIVEMYYLLGSEKLGIGIEKFIQMSNIAELLHDYL